MYCGVEVGNELNKSIKPVILRIFSVPDEGYSKNASCILNDITVVRDKIL
jgi:hypothetical protein